MAVYHDKVETKPLLAAETRQPAALRTASAALASDLTT